MTRQMTGAKMVVQALKDQGVDTVFGYPGGAVLPIYDEIFLQNDIRHILVRHEQGAVHAAEEHRHHAAFQHENGALPFANRRRYGGQRSGERGEGRT